MEILKYPSESAENKINSIISERGLDFSEEQFNSVQAILDDVKINGDKALIKYINKFDAPELTMDSIQVTEKEFSEAEKKVDSDFLKALDRACEQVESFHKKQLQNSWFTNVREGVFLGQMVTPVDGAGIYVPGATGGKTPLVSSVIMGCIPAKIAGVKNISITTPPMKDGSVNPYILMAAKKIGVDRVYKAGSAWSIAALTYGTETVEKVDVIAGPGNIFVTIAKKIVSGTVGIDMIAGPSEILVIADENANPEYAAADLLSQAEHDALSSAVLVTTSEALARKTIDALNRQLDNLSRKEITAKSIKDFGACFVVPDIETAIELSNNIAPEHLELLVKEPFQYIGKIRNAGAVFMGEYSPEPIGDYVAGPNHVLPTVSTARFSSALSVDIFVKKTSLINYSKEAFEKEAEDVICLADIEGLTGHANSIKVRLK